MNKRNTSDLKKRLADLRISEPLRLTRPGQAPTENKSTSQSEVPPSEAPREPLVQKEVPRIEPTQNDPPRSERARDKLPLIELTASRAPHIEPPQIEQPPVEQDKTEQAQKELPHVGNSEVGGPQNEVPPLEVDNKRSQGFFKLSHAIFSHTKLRELSGDCFRLFLWLSSRAWRYPDSDGTLRASVTYIESHVGMGHATISRGLKALKESGLISLEEVNFKRGNLWRISPVALGSFDPESTPPRSKVPQPEAPKNGVDAASKRGGSLLNLSKKPPQSEQQIRNSNKQKNSLESGGEPARFEVAVAAFENQVPADKREAIKQEFIARQFPSGVFVSDGLMSKLVALDWYSQLRSAPVANVG